MKRREAQAIRTAPLQDVIKFFGCKPSELKAFSEKERMELQLLLTEEMNRQDVSSVEQLQ